jgi:HEAT repeat protein
MAKPSPDAVFLIHGTFSHRAEDASSADANDLEKAARWWQNDSDFVSELNTLLHGRAECWPEEVCAEMPWRARSLGNRLEGWTVFGRRPLCWLRSRHRITGRRLFAWSGLNSESERRVAGRRLFEGLKALEEGNKSRIEAGGEPRYYHLIGHSHGGSVIWNALRIASGRNEPLPHLRSWITLGTPFPTYRPIRFLWLIGLLGLGVMAAGAWLALRGDFVQVPRPLTLGQSWLTLRALLDPGSPANLFPYGLSPGTVALLSVLLVLTAWYAVAVFTWAFRTLETWLDRRGTDKAWRSFGKQWLGLFSEIDEAIAGSQNTVGLYASDLVRLSWPGLPPAPRGWNPLELALVLPTRYAFWIASWVTVPVTNGVLLPLAEWVISLVFRMKFQGSDRLGANLTLISPEPFSRESFPDEPARGPLPPALARPLLAHTHEDVDARIFDVRTRFAADARSSRSPKELLRAYFADLKITNEFIHNSYHEVSLLRHAIAHSILKSGVGGSSPDHLDALDPKARAWLDAPPSTPPSLDYLPRPKPPSATPVWTRCLLACACALLCFAGFHGLRTDIHDVYLDQMVKGITKVDQKNDNPLSKEPTEDHERLIRKAFETFRPYSEQRLIELISQRDATSRLKGVEFLREFVTPPPGRRASLSNAARPGLLNPDTIAELVRLTFDVETDQVIRIGIIQTLLAFPDHKAVADELIRACLDEDRGSRLRGSADQDWTNVAASIMLQEFGSEVVPGIVNLLRSSNPSQIKAAAIALRETRVPAASQATEPLLRHVGHEDPTVRFMVWTAIRSMGVSATPQIVDPLLKELQSEDHNLRSIAASTLGSLRAPGAPRAIEPLTKALDDPDPWVRSSAAYALGKQGADAVEPLIKALGHTDASVRDNATRGLGTIGPEAGPRAVEALVRTLVNDGEFGNIRVAAAYALGEIGFAAAPQAVEPIARLLGSVPNPSEAFSVDAEALRRFGPLAIEILVKDLADPNPTVRFNATRALGVIGAPAGPRAAEPLVGFFRNAKEDPGFRSAVAGVLRSIGAPAAAVALGPMIEVLEDSKESPIHRADAAYALSAFGAAAVPRAIKPLVDVLKDRKQNLNLRVAAVIGLGGLGAPEASEVVDLLVGILGDRKEDPGVRVNAAIALRVKFAAAAPRALDPLLAIVGDPNEDVNVRANAADALGVLGASASSPALQPLLKILVSKNNVVLLRTSAAVALGSIGANGDTRVVEPLVRILEEDNKEDSNIRLVSVRALGTIGAPAAPRAIDVLKSAMGDRDENMRTAAAEALGRIHLHSLVAALERKNDDVRAIAATALAKINPPLETVEPYLINLIIIGDINARRGALGVIQAIRNKNQAGPKTP